MFRDIGYGKYARELPRKINEESLYPFKRYQAPLNEPPKIVRYRLDVPEDKEERRLHEELYGHAPLMCGVEYQGKIYAGTLYFDRLKK